MTLVTNFHIYYKNEEKSSTHISVLNEHVHVNSWMRKELSKVENEVLSKLRFLM